MTKNYIIGVVFKRKKILCYVLIFDQVEIIKKSLDFLSQNSSKLDLIIIENPSGNTPKIKKYVQQLGKKRLIKRYYLFDENITSNAMVAILDKEIDRIAKSPYTIITDGDLISNDQDWLGEEMKILKNNKNVFACGISLDMSNLPIKAFPEAKSWIPPDVSEQPDYYEAATGGHLMMLRGKDFAEYIRWKNENKVLHIDNEMRKYCYDLLHKKWARTKKSKAYHLTWDLYADKNHPYTKFRSQKSFKETWNHSKKAAYKLYEY
jgi:hypothetical protein